MFKRGFVSLPFLIVFSISMTLCAYLSYKTITEVKILESLKDVNHQIQIERLIVESVRCLIQCEHPQTDNLIIEDEEVWLEFLENTCNAYTSFGKIEIQFDTEEKRILSVTLE